MNMIFVAQVDGVDCLFFSPDKERSMSFFYTWNQFEEMIAYGKMLIVEKKGFY